MPSAQCDIRKKNADQMGEGRRLVLFVGGFDPRGARYYHQLMTREAAEQSKITGQEYVVGGRTMWPACEHKASMHKHAMWTVCAEKESGCDYVFVDWSDQVREHWPKKTWRVWLQALQTYACVYRERKVLAPLHKQTPYTLWTLFYPLVYALLCIAIAAGSFLLLINSMDGAYGFGGASCAALLVLFAGYKLDQKLHVSWLLRILNFARTSAHEPLKSLNLRLEEMAASVAQQIQTGRYPEVVVVGFSVGSTVAVALVHQLRQHLLALSDTPQPLHLVTLGNCLPLFTLMPQQDETLRKPLFALAQDAHLHWIDISSPGDSVSFGMCDLVALSLPKADVTDLQRCVNPRHMCSPRFHKLFRPSTYRWLRRNKVRMHFQYLMASELPGTYDFFAFLTCRGSLMAFVSKRLVR